jgi:hypothetical protein
VRVDYHILLEGRVGHGFLVERNQVSTYVRARVSCDCLSASRQHKPHSFCNNMLQIKVRVQIMLAVHAV